MVWLGASLLLEMTVHRKGLARIPYNKEKGNKRWREGERREGEKKLACVMYSINPLHDECNIMYCKHTLIKIKIKKKDLKIWEPAF